MQSAVVDALFRDVSLTRQALHSFDDFVHRIVPKVVDNHRPIEVKPDLSCYDDSVKPHIIRIDSVRYDVPSTMEKNGDIRLCTPMEARMRDLMYSVPMYVNVHYTHTINEKEVTETHKDVFFARMPVMVRSSLCSLKPGEDYKNGECPHDPGGYFVVNGREKTLVVQERISPNIIFCFSPTECLYHAEYNSVANRVATLRIKVRKFGSSPFVVQIPGFPIDIPIIILWRALGGIDDEFLLSIDGEDARTSIDDASVAATREEALEWLSKNCEEPLMMMERCVYPNISAPFKCKHLILQWETYLDCLHQNKFHDRDHVRAKRLDTAGAMLGTMFTHLFHQMLANIRKMAVTLLNKNKKIRPHRLIQPCHITDGIKYALATGKWKIKNSAFAGRVGVSQLLNRNTYISCISQLRRVDTGIDSQQKIIAPRLLYGNQWGYMCPSETPEGGPCGLVKQLALSAYITTQCDFTPIHQIIVPYEVVSGSSLIFHNGAPVSSCTNPTELVSTLRSARRDRVISTDACVALENDNVYIWTDSGRLSRPVFVVKDGLLLITEEQVNDLKDGRLHFDDLFTLGVVENLSIYEEEYALIALKPQDTTKKHTHCELDPSLILGTLASTIPYPDHNQSPRNVYQAAMGKQAMGIYASNFSKRFDTNGHVMHYPQKPLVTTRAAKALCGDQLPAGMQAIVAIMCFGGYNQEDSLLFNQSAVDRGFGRSTTFRTYSASNSSTRQAPASEFKRQESYGQVNTQLDFDGLSKPGTSIDKGKAIFCNVTPGKKYPHIVKNKKSDGIVDSTILFQNANGGQTAKTRIREQRIPEMGDKFCISLSSYVMTSNGWVQLRDITPQHKVATLRDGQYLDYVHPTNKYIFDCHDEELYHLDAQQVKIICTKNHKLYVKKRYRDKFEFVNAKDAFGKRVRHKKDATNDRLDQEFILIGGTQYKMDPFLKLLGSFLSDGCTNRKSICLSMQKQRKRDFIQPALEELGIHYSVHAKRVYIGTTSRQLVDYFKVLSVGAANKSLPQFVWELSQRQSVILMNALLQGDGSYNKNGSAGYYTSSKQLAEDVQRLALHCGWSGTIKLYKGHEKGQISVFKDGHSATLNYDALAVRIVKKKNNPQVNHGHVHEQSRQTEEYIKFTGQVGCIEVPHSHLFFYKEDLYSPPCWTGNSSRHGQKGTIGMMYRQEDLPWTAEGIVPDLIVNPHAIPSRMTIGHVFECVSSKLASLLGIRVDATAFSHKPVEEICSMLKKAGYAEDGKEVMYHPYTGKRLEGRVFIGPTFYQRLKHMVGDKLHARNKGKIVGLTRQPVDGRANGGGLRWGEMERDCGVAHGASAVLAERMMISSDAYDATICTECGLIGTVITDIMGEYMCAACKGKQIQTVQMPYAGKLLMQELMSSYYLAIPGHMSKKRQFRWQINASAVGSLLGHFGDDRRKKALAECWLMNIKRMQRFGAVPAEVVSQETTAEIVQKEMAQKPEYAKHIQNGIQDSQKQKEAVAHIKKTAVEQVTNAKRKHDDMQQIVEEIKKINIIQQYTTKKSGTKRSKIGSFFSVNDKLYHKTSRKTSTLSDYKTAAAHGYQTLQAKETAHHEKETEQRQAANSLKRAKIVNENIIKQATKTINTTRGTIRESTDLELVQKRFPNCAPGNDKAYFMNLSSSSGYSGFVIGKIDGQSPGIIFELKHRQARLFEQLRRYEQVQVMLYMKMTRCPHAMLVETYKGKQNYFELKLSHGGLCHFRAEGGNWQRGMQFSGIKEGLEQAIEMLNTAEKDPTFRKELKKHLF